MTTRERMLAAWRCQEVDYVPITLEFAEDHKHPKATWKNERERLGFFRGRDWDTTAYAPGEVTPLPEVKTRIRYETLDGQPVLHQVWQTPGGNLEESLRVTPDWAIGNRDDDHPVGFLDDFRTTRYVEFPLKTEADLAALPYLFPEENASDSDRLRRDWSQARALADEFEIPLLADLCAGLDWLLWLYPPEEIIVRAQLEPGFVHGLLDTVNRAYEKRLELLLELGVDGVYRRGWYESGDFWNPQLFREFAHGPLEREIRMAHDAGSALVYFMDSGVMPLLGELATLDFDCMYGVNPLGQPLNLKRMRETLHGKSLWGGISGVFHLCRGTPATVERAVEEAFEMCGNLGFILGAIAGIRDYYPWENIEAFEAAWRKLRDGKNGSK